jgi:hypothetical protein
MGGLGRGPPVSLPRHGPAVVCSGASPARAVAVSAAIAGTAVASSPQTRSAEISTDSPSLVRVMVTLPCWFLSQAIRFATSVVSVSQR